MTHAENQGSTAHTQVKKQSLEKVTKKVQVLDLIRQRFFIQLPPPLHQASVLWPEVVTSSELCAYLPESVPLDPCPGQTQHTHLSVFLFLPEWDHFGEHREG